MKDLKIIIIILISPGFQKPDLYLISYLGNNLLVTDTAPKLEAKRYFYYRFFNKEGEDSYLKCSQVQKKYKSVYLINYIYVVILSGKVVIFCCF